MGDSKAGRLGRKGLGVFGVGTRSSGRCEPVGVFRWHLAIVLFVGIAVLSVL